MDTGCKLFLLMNWGVVGGVMSIFGFLGNFLSFMAFSKPKRYVRVGMTAVVMLS